MKFDSSIYDYLVGSRFSNGLAVRIADRDTFGTDRIHLLERIVSGKRVIHLGCVDHLPIIEQKIKDNLWLHARLSKIADRCLGVDINLEGIDLLRRRYGYKDVLCADLAREDAPQIQLDYWDYLVAGELLEHVDDPVAFLSAIHIRYADHIDKIVLTVPHAFALSNLRNAFRHIEYINSDHRYWFTPYTLAKIVTLAGMRVESYWFCETNPIVPKNWKSRVWRAFNPTYWILGMFPALCENILMIAKL